MKTKYLIRKLPKTKKKGGARLDKDDPEKRDLQKKRVESSFSFPSTNHPPIERKIKIKSYSYS